MTDTITVRGFIGTAPESRQPASGTEVTTFRLGSTPRWRDAHTGEWSSGSTNWYSVAAFGRLAGNVADSINKGDPVVVVGRPKVRRWENDDGIKGTELEIRAHSVAHDLNYGITTFSKRSSSSTADHELQSASRHDDGADMQAGQLSSSSEPQSEDYQSDGTAMAAPASASEVARPASPAAEIEPGWHSETSLQRVS